MPFEPNLYTRVVCLTTRLRALLTRLVTDLSYRRQQSVARDGHVAHTGVTRPVERSNAGRGTARQPHI